VSYCAPNWLIAGITGLVLLAPSALSQEQATSDAQRQSDQQQAVLKIAKEVRKQIVMNPRYGVFDSINFGIQGTDTVILRGYASRPVLKSDLESSANYPGVVLLPFALS
jgi:hyperosmotically inducible protein